MKDQKNLGLPEHIFIAFRCHFDVLICKKASFVSFSFDSYSVDDE
jgi:hypothetical protein